MAFRNGGSVAIFVLALSGCGALAQESHGYAYIAPGGLTSLGRTRASLELGGGGEVRIVRGFGAGAEGAYVAATERLGSGIGIASVNGYFHPVTDRLEKFDPFVTAGYSLMFRTSAANAFNYGAGFNYWLHSGLGLKVEFRDHMWRPGSLTLHYWGIRFGLNFR